MHTECPHGHTVSAYLWLPACGALSSLLPPMWHEPFVPCSTRMWIVSSLILGCVPRSWPLDEHTHEHVHQWVEAQNASIDLCALFIYAAQINDTRVLLTRG